MADLLRQGCQWLEQMRVTHCSGPAIYHRGESELAVNATLSATTYEVEDEYGVRIAASVCDFLISSVELAAMGEPQLGDRIVADGRVYEVLSLGSQGHWRWSDPYRTTMRIHAKQIDEVDS